jgi:hypothetical protein
MLDCFFESGLTVKAEIQRAQSAYGMVKLHGCQRDFQEGVKMALLTGGNLVASSSNMSLIGVEPTP